VFGGLDSTAMSREDPYAVDDRGLWFDGRYNYLTISGLVFGPYQTSIFWIKPHGDGVIMSNNNNSGNSSYTISVVGSFVVFDTGSEEWKPDVEIIEAFTW
jgi:hypothetical protein